MMIEVASGKMLDRWAKELDVDPRGEGEPDDALRHRILAKLRPTPQKTISRQGLNRAIARIISELETIREEGYDRDGNPTWYALDRLEQIRATAKLAIEGNELACVGGAPGADYGGSASRFDDHFETEINPDKRIDV